MPPSQKFYDDLVRRISEEFDSASCATCGCHLGKIGYDGNHHIVNSADFPIIGYTHYCAAHCPECKELRND